MSLISNLDAQAGKTPFQTYTIQHGIESIEVLVPLKNAKPFEEQIKNNNLPNRQSVLEVVVRHGGQLK